MKKYLIVLAVILIVLIISCLALFLLKGNEDRWICVDNDWVKHGNPSSPKPLHDESCPGTNVCSMEAKLCPDGKTSVGRQGPNCDFAECPVAQAVDETADWQTYKSDKYGFEFKYPSDWKKIDDKSVVDGVNKLFLISEVSENPGADGARRFIVEVSGKKSPLYIYDSNEKQNIVVSGLDNTVYFFPNGYECGMATPERVDCSFFAIPIERNGLWYKIYGSGDAKTILPYKQIIDSFKFTK